MAEREKGLLAGRMIKNQVPKYKQIQSLKDVANPKPQVVRMGQVVNSQEFV